MTIPIFLELVEIKAKTASVLPFFIGICFSYYVTGTIRLEYIFWYFIAMVLFNMFVDVWDNYQDYHRAKDQDYRMHTNIIGREQLSLSLIEKIMWVLFLTSLCIGLILSYYVGWPLFIMGGVCFAIGLLYSAGPRPLSSLPLGECLSGFTMGFMITLICVYLNASGQFEWSLKQLMHIAVISLPNTLWIANLMLANNVCDKEEDEKNHRFTLVHYIGIKGGLWLFSSANIIAFLAIILQVVIGIAPPSVLFSLLLIPFVYQQTMRFLHKQVKCETFVCAVRILALGSSVHVLTYVMGIV